MTRDDLQEMINQTPRDHEVLVGASDPQHGPYTAAVRVRADEVVSQRVHGFRRVSPKEIAAMTEPFEDFTDTWKHSD